jgi:catechol 2,3-dioxygenase-like lactoylglutathione lyase family enzyme
MVRGVANVWVPVQDIERALDFYQNTLGFQPIKRDGPWAEIDAGGLNIGLDGREPEGAQAGGGPVIRISEHEWGRVATFKDTEGNDLQLYELPR